LRDALREGHRRVVLQAPTGSGKTILAAGAIDSALSKGKRVVFTVPALELIDQTVTRLFEQGITDVGVIQGKHPMEDWSKPVQVASVQTLMNRERPETDLWMIDECHVFFKYYETLFAEATQPIIGLSATPWTKGLGKWYSKLVVAATMRELQTTINPATDAPYLVTESVLAPTHIDLGDVKTVAGDYHQGQLADKMNRPDLIGDIVRTWQKEGQGRSTIMFGVDRAHAKSTQKAFENAGIPCGYIDGFSDRTARRAVRDSFERGGIKVVCSIGCLTTGVDWDVRCIILARPTKSEMLFVQMIGRGLRPAEAKEDCLILDHTDTYQRLGFAADIHHGKLHDGKTRGPVEAERKIKLPVECKGRFEGEPCGRIKQPGEHMCNRCGFAPERVNGITFADGELGAMEHGARADRAAQADFYAQLKWIAKAKDYKPGWTEHKFKAKFKEFPPKSWRSVIKPMPPGREVNGWVQHMAIRYRHSTRKGDLLAGSWEGR